MKEQEVMDMDFEPLLREVSKPDTAVGDGDIGS
jgi:hypothetical protein